MAMLKLTAEYGNESSSAGLKIEVLLVK